MPKPTLPSGQTVKWNDSGNLSVYANIMGFSMSPFDISLLFGEIGEASPTEVAATLRTRVILSPEQVSNLIKLLSLALESYIASNGTLRHGGAVNVEEVTAQMNKSKMTVPN
jgi:hypothetical protein